MISREAQVPLAGKEMDDRRWTYSTQCDRSFAVEEETTLASLTSLCRYLCNLHAEKVHRLLKVSDLEEAMFDFLGVFTTNKKIIHNITRMRTQISSNCERL